MCRTIHKIALITNLTQSLGGVEFKIDSQNNKAQYSIDGGANWLNFSGGGISKISLQQSLAATLSGTNRELYAFDMTLTINGTDYTSFVCYVSNINPRNVFQCDICTITATGTQFTVVLSVDAKVNGTNYQSGDTVQASQSSQLTVERL